MKEKRNMWGIVLILCAAFVLINQYNIFGSINLFKILISIALVIVTMSGVKHRDFPTILFPIAFIIILFDKELGLQALTPFPILVAALLASVGLTLLFPKSFRSDSKRRIIDLDDEHTEYSSTTDSEVRYSVTMGSGIKYINSSDFKSATLYNSFSGSKIYFDAAKVPSGHAAINVELSFSGLELYIPREWNLIQNIDCFLGGVEIKGTPVASGGPTVELNGRAKFGGITIYYV